MFQPEQHVVVITPKAFEKDSEITEFLGKNLKITKIHHEDLSSGLSLPASSADAVFSYSASMKNHTPTLLAEVARVLKPGGKFIMREIVTNDEKDTSGKRLAKDLFPALTVSGFVDSSLNMLDEASHTVQAIASKPKYEVGATASLSLKPKAAVAPKQSVWKIASGNDDADLEPAKPAQAKAGSWKIAVNEDDDIIDENELVRPEDFNTKPAVVSDCGPSATGKARACKNCTCGLAEKGPSESKSILAQAQPGTTVTVDTTQMKSSCGSCSLGDGFRCPGCPYRGLPAFKPGEKITISL
jgi:SAM-dependent methyltransferase